MNSSSKHQNITEATADNAPKTGGYSSSDAAVSRTQRRLSGLLLGALDVLRDGLNDPELPAQTAAMFLQVASQVEPKGVVELGALVGMSKASASRLVQTLGRGMREKPGLGLVEAYEDPTNWSRKLVKLTPKGVRLIGTLEMRMLSGLRSIQTEE